MTKENIEKITKVSSPWNADEISVEEKKRLADFFYQKGFSKSTFYLRFFRYGFDEWEILGVKECKKQFLAIPEVAKTLLDFVEDASSPEDKGYLYTLAHSDEPGVFYSCLKKVKSGLCIKFHSFMNNKGMMSQTTVARSFSCDDFKIWEQEGIKSLLHDFQKRH